MPMIRRASFATPGGSEKSLLAFVKHVKKLSCTREPSFCLAALMLSSVLPHTRFCKASRGGGAFSVWGMIASFFGLKARACGSLSVPVLERYNLLVRLSMSGSFPSPLSRCGAFHSALSTLYRNAERLLFPVHQWAMKVLSRLPADGAFDQERPLSTVPWVSTLNTFLIVPPMVKRVSEIAFLTGQPLGYYGSWSLFALSHHYMVWLAAKYAYPTSTTPFADYALLAKSIISENGTLEFAKRFWTKDMQIYLSPISLRALTSCRTTVGLCQLATKYSISTSILPIFWGAGFRVRSRLMSTQSKRWERLKAAASKPHRWVKQWLKWVSWYHTVAASAEVTIDQLMEVPINGRLRRKGFGWGASTSSPKPDEWEMALDLPDIQVAPECLRSHIKEESFLRFDMKSPSKLLDKGAIEILGPYECVMTRGRLPGGGGSSVVGKRETRLYEPEKGCTAVVGALRPELFVVLAGMQVNESHPLASEVLTPL
ncbi:hypothetical protein KY289_008170 [Solanum tuberosum]|nr:hypothetical protein KY289_008170 [Solanum tuberosum]